MSISQAEGELAVKSADGVAAGGVFQSVIEGGLTSGTVIVLVTLLVLLLLSLVIIIRFFNFMGQHNVGLADNNLRLLTIALLLPTIAILAMIENVDRGLIALISAIAGYVLGQAGNPRRGNRDDGSSSG